MNDAKQCPWCERWCLKDAACNYIFACGLPTGSSSFVVGTGCGRSWCWQCGKKFCGTYIDPNTGLKNASAREHHDASCCAREPGFAESDYCPGGHNSHCAKRYSS
jgi:hypothetical protein